LTSVFVVLAAAAGNELFVVTGELVTETTDAVDLVVPTGLGVLQAGSVDGTTLGLATGDAATLAGPAGLVPGALAIPVCAVMGFTVVGVGVAVVFTTADNPTPGDLGSGVTAAETAGVSCLADPDETTADPKLGVLTHVDDTTADDLAVVNVEVTDSQRCPADTEEMVDNTEPVALVPAATDTVVVTLAVDDAADVLETGLLAANAGLGCRANPVHVTDGDLETGGFAPTAGPGCLADTGLGALTLEAEGTKDDLTEGIEALPGVLTDDAPPGVFAAVAAPEGEELPVMDTPEIAAEVSSDETDGAL
jgi:hypothetical protein